MAWKRKKNNRARNILKRIRKRGHRSSRFVKSVRAIANKTIKRRAEHHTSTEAVSITSVTLPTGADLCNSVTHDVLASIYEQSIVTTGNPVTAVTFNTGQQYRMGKKIANVRMSYKTRVELSISELTLTNSVSEKFWLRLMVWQPKRMGDLDEAIQYMTNTFGSNVSTTVSLANIFAYVDDTQITMLKDTGVIYFQVAEGKLHHNFHFSKFYKALSYVDNTDHMPEQNMPQMTMAFGTGTQNPVTWNVWICRRAKFVDV